MLKMNGKILFVDFFDTIMFRHVHPFQILDRWSKLVIGKYSLNITIKDLNNLRKSIYSKASENSYEIKYADFIQNLYCELKPTDSFEDFCGYCLQLEEALEIGVQHPNSKFINFLKKQKENGVSIYIVSDFHLSESSLIKFLKAQNVDTTLFDGVYVSCDYNAKKANGTLYKFVLNKLNIDPSNVYMIGDDYNNDYVQAKKKGLNTIYKPRTIRKTITKIKRILKYDYTKHVRNCFLNDCYKTGTPFSEYVSLFFSFTNELYKNTKDYEKIIFLAREGFYFKQLYDLYNALLIPKGLETQTKYFLCSRRAINSIDENKVFSILRNKEISVGDALKACGFNDDEIKEICIKRSLDTEHLITEEIVFSLQSAIKSKISINRDCFNKYCEHYFDKDRLNCVIDVGWKGTMQAGIVQNYCENVKGYYLGLIGDASNKLNINKKGLLFDENNRGGGTSMYSGLIPNFMNC